MGVRLVFLATAAFALASSAPTDAGACGGFFARRATVTVPSLQVEHVLVLWDPAKEEEHFVRQLVFRDAKEPFGFVVPTPSRPTVAKVDAPPFALLERRYPPEGHDLTIGGGGAGVQGGGRGLGSVDGAPKVTVITKERIGSFTAFVLAATDAVALEGWLKENGLTTTPASAAWLARYVKLGFYYTAFRYEPKAPSVDAGAAKGLASETVRISFATPLPFYPYHEPAHPTPPAEPRVLAVWFVAPERSLPVSSVAGILRRPWTEDRTHWQPSPDSLGAELGPLGALLPAARGDRLVVQTFEDQKTSRDGWGDVVLVPEDPTTLSPERRARAAKLAAALEAR